MTVETLLTDYLAVARLSRLATSDRVTRRPRRAAVARAYEKAGRALPMEWDLFGPATVTDDPDAPEAAYLLSCPWCVSPYCAVLVFVLRATVPGLWGPIARVLAASQVAGTLAK